MKIPNKVALLTEQKRLEKEIGILETQWEKINRVIDKIEAESQKKLDKEFDKQNVLDEKMNKLDDKLMKVLDALDKIEEGEKNELQKKMVKKLEGK